MLLRSLMGREPTYFPVGVEGSRSDLGGQFLPHPPFPGEASSLTIHLPHGAHIVTGVLEADKAIALGFACALVTDHLSLKEGWETAEGSGQDVIVHLIAQIPTEDPEVIWIRREEVRASPSAPPSPVSAQNLQLITSNIHVVVNLVSGSLTGKPLGLPRPLPTEAEESSYCLNSSQAESWEEFRHLAAESYPTFPLK